MTSYSLHHNCNMFGRCGHEHWNLIFETHVAFPPHTSLTVIDSSICNILTPQPDRARHIMILQVKKSLERVIPLS